jgi:hypothetical protein
MIRYMRIIAIVLIVAVFHSQQLSASVPASAATVANQQTSGFLLQEDFNKVINEIKAWNERAGKPYQVKVEDVLQQLPVWKTVLSGQLQQEPVLLAADVVRIPDFKLPALQVKTETPSYLLAQAVQETEQQRLKKEIEDRELRLRQLQEIQDRTQATEPAKTVVVQQIPQTNPLVSETVQLTNGKEALWQLVVPQRPDDRLTRLTPKRLDYGFILIQELGLSKVQEFINRYKVEVRRGPNAWETAERLVIQYAGERVLTDPVVEESKPEEIEILTTPEQIVKYAAMDPVRDFTRMDWQRDPVGVCVIKQRPDFLNNWEAIERQIDRVYKLNPNTGEAIKKAGRACVGSKGNSPLCYDIRMDKINFLLRNHGGTGSVGEYESYLKGTNRPDAHATVFYVPGVGYKGLGWECCGNLLEFFVRYLFSGRGSTVAQPPSKNLVCELTVNPRVLESDNQCAQVNLSVTPSLTEDTIFAANFTLPGVMHRATTLGGLEGLKVCGSQLPNQGVDYPVIAQVTVGTQTVTCEDKVRLLKPVPPLPPPPPPKPADVPCQTTCFIPEVQALKHNAKSVLVPFQFPKDAGEVDYTVTIVSDHAKTQTFTRKQLHDMKFGDAIQIDPKDSGPGKYTLLLNGTYTNPTGKVCKFSCERVVEIKRKGSKKGLWLLALLPLIALAFMGKGGGSKTPVQNPGVPRDPTAR